LRLLEHLPPHCAHLLLSYSVGPFLLFSQWILGLWGEFLRASRTTNGVYPPARPLLCAPTLRSTRRLCPDAPFALTSAPFQEQMSAPLRSDRGFPVFCSFFPPLPHGGQRCANFNSPFLRPFEQSPPFLIFQNQTNLFFNARF